MRWRWAAIAALCVAAATASRVAHVGVVDDLAVWIDHDAPVVIRTEPAQIERAAALAERLGVPGAAEMRQVSRLARQSGLGADLLTRDGWRDAGFDERAPVLVSLAAVNAPAVARALASTRRGRRMETPIWRSRIAARVRDGSRVDGLIKRMARLAPPLSGVSTVETPLIARLLGATVMQSMRLAADLQKRGIIAVGYFEPTQSLVFVMRRGNTLLIDMLGTFDGVRPTWKRMRGRLLGVLDRGAGRFSRRINTGAANELKRRGTTVWADAERVYDTIEAHRATTMLALERRGVVSRDQLTALPAACDDFRKVASAGPFRDVAVRTVLGARRVDTHATWGMRTLFKMSAPFLVSNDQLPLPRVSTTGPVAAGALFVRGLGHLRAIPRPSALQTSFVQMWRDMAACGLGATATLALFGGPQVLGLFLEDLAKIHPDAAVLIGGLRNGVMSADALSQTLKGLRMTVAATGTKAAIPVARRMLTTVFGPATGATGPSRVTATWGSGPMRPFAFRTAVGAEALGISLPAAGVAQYVAARPAPMQSARAVVGQLDVDLARALPQLVPGTMGHQLGARLTRLTSRLAIEPDTVVLSTRLSLAP